VVGAVAFAQDTVSIDLSLATKRAARLAAEDSNQEISVILLLPLGDPQGAATFVRSVSNPNDRLYHRYLTPETFAARFGAMAQDYEAVKAWAIANGLRIVHEAKARTALTIRGTVAQFQTLFRTQLAIYQGSDGKRFYSASAEPTVPSEIASKVSGVIGLTNSVQDAAEPKVFKSLGEDPATSLDRPDIGGTGPEGGYSSSNLRSVYSIPGFGGATAQTVAVFEQGGFFKSDIDTYIKKMRLTYPLVGFVGVNGYNGTVNSVETELAAARDIEIIIAINPNVSQVLAYEDGVDPFQVAIIDALNQVADDNRAQTLSIPYWLDEVQQGASQIAAENTALTQLAAQGIAVMASAGDEGAYGNTGPSYYPTTQLEAPDPGSQPLVTCVGGTTLFTGPNEGYFGEVVWNNGGAPVLGATGGGVSSFWAIPEYQTPNYVTGNGGSSTMRNVPDVAAVADPATGVAIYSKVNGGWLEVGGTAVSTSIWAGYYSILNSGYNYLLGTNIGQFNPLLYNIGYSALNPVPQGTNGDPGFYLTPGYTAGQGYNNCAGSGTPSGIKFALTVLTSATGGRPPSTFIFLPTKLGSGTAKVEWTPASGANGYILVLSNFTTAMTTPIYLTKDTHFVFTGLTPKTRYSCYTYAVNSGGVTSNETAWTEK
jgi:kumamolisin